MPVFHFFMNEVFRKANLLVNDHLFIRTNQTRSQENILSLQPPVKGPSTDPKFPRDFLSGLGFHLLRISNDKYKIEGWAILRHFALSEVNGRQWGKKRVANQKYCCIKYLYLEN